MMIETGEMKIRLTRFDFFFGGLMLKPISRKMHGLIADYPYIAFTAAAPELVGFKDEATAARLCRTLSGGVLAASLLTRAEWGVYPAISFKTHLALDAASSVFAASAPWLFGFSGNKRARNTFLALGIVGIVAGLLTQPKEMNASESQRKFPHGD